MACRGYEVVVVELGAGLAGVARRNLADFEAVRVVTGLFERWSLPDERFDAAVAATSFHWLEHVLRIEKAAGTLWPGGALAVISTHHVAGGEQQFFVDVQRWYERWMPGTAPGLCRCLHNGRRQRRRRVGTFCNVVVRRYERELRYSTGAYLDPLPSYANRWALAEPARSGLLACIARPIDDRYEGRITERYMGEFASAFLARARARPRTAGGAPIARRPVRAGRAYSPAPEATPPRQRRPSQQSSISAARCHKHGREAQRRFKLAPITPSSIHRPARAFTRERRGRRP